MTAPDSYISWRMSMGFSKEESERLYNLIDSSNEFELRAYLQSRDSKHYEKIGMASGTFQLACDRLVNSGPTRMKIGMMVTLFNTSMIRNLDVAMMGRYNESFQLMRSSIESGLRLCFNLMKVYESDFFDNFLSNIDWKDDDPPWRDALKVERGLDIGGMSRCIDRIGFGRPIRSIYHHFKIGDLNSFTHSNITRIAEGEGNYLKNLGVIEYDDEKFELSCKLWVRYFEFLLIFMQHTLDKLVPSIEPILIPGTYPEMIFPNYSKLSTSTKLRNISL